MSDRERLKAAIDAGDFELFERALSDDPALARADLAWDGGGPVQTALIYLIQAPFHGRCPGGHQSAMLQSLLAAGADADWDPLADPRGETPLMTAVSLYETDLVRALLEHGVDLERRGGVIGGGTALDNGVHFSASREVDLLRANGARCSSLAVAAGAGAFDEVLRRHGTGEALDATALWLASINERMDIVDWLLDAGVDPSSMVEGASLLHWVAWAGRPVAARRLLEAGVDRSLRDPNHGLTAAQWARYRRDEKRWPFPRGLSAVVEVLESEA